MPKSPAADPFRLISACDRCGDPCAELDLEPIHDLHDEDTAWTDWLCPACVARLERELAEELREELTFEEYRDYDRAEMLAAAMERDGAWFLDED